MRKLNSSSIFHFLYIGILIVFFSSCKQQPDLSTFRPELALEYQEKLLNLHELESFRVGKNSFVLGLETISNLPKLIGENGRTTILDLKGQGSLRHIWQYYGQGEPPYYLEFYVDGEDEPSIKATIDELVQSATKVEQSFAYPAASIVNNDSYNLYLPVPFEKSLRVELVAHPKIGMVFLQLDYRLEDNSMQDIKLIQKEPGSNEEGIKLEYQSSRNLSDEKQELPLTFTKNWRFRGDTIIKVQGPAIIRRLSLNSRRRGVRMKVRYENEKTNAVDVDISDFFGPFRGVVLNNNQSYFPMPFKESIEIEISGSSDFEEWILETDIEPVSEFNSNWGYFHALHTQVDSSLSYQPFQVLSTNGRGQFVGMSLFDTHHDHGGGDFIIIDGETSKPSFLHGINGEDYFSFALFGKGENFPYSEAFDNDQGRMRVHFENVHPFTESLDIYWAVTGGLSPRAVAFWYQDSPKDHTIAASEESNSRWFVFGPVTVNHMEEDGNTPDVSDLDRLFGGLPDPKSLDQSGTYEIEHVIFNKIFEGNSIGWQEQYSDRNFLNLMYIYGHLLNDLGAYHHMGYYPRAMMAKKKIEASEDKEVKLRISYDDPLQVFLNGEKIYSDNELHRGFVTRAIPAELKSGKNILLLKLLDTPNVNTMWAGFNLEIID